MELRLNLDDDDFQSSTKQPELKSNITYVPKQCSPNWFLEKANISDGTNQSVVELKFAADIAFMKKNFGEAISLYTKVLEESSKHKVTSSLLNNQLKVDKC